jgi:hypothetical protein
MDGVLNNSLFANIWAVGPPPDASQEFNVQSHITDLPFTQRYFFDPYELIAC